MDYIVNNWALIITCLAIVVFVAINVINFFKKPSDERIEALRQWALWATLSAERELGSGTGKLKLRYVYDMFLTKFPDLSQLISFDKFSGIVDEALVESKALLSSNKNIEQYVENADNK